MIIELPRRQRELFNLLLGKGDVLISQMYEHMFYQNKGATEDRPVADLQRRLSPYISLLNKSLVAHNMKVEPGALKNTYRLVAVEN